MIIKSFPSIKAVVAALLPISDETKKLADKFKLTTEEFTRRDEVVREMYNKNPWKEGDVLIPKNEKDLKNYGKCTVRKVYKTYSDFSPHDEWPKHDQPYIVSITTEHGVGGLVCTPNWLTREQESCSC